MLYDMLLHTVCFFFVLQGSHWNKGDQLLLMTTESGSSAVKCAWGDSPGVFEAALKTLRVQYQQPVSTAYFAIIQ
jgi:hypothetical protein